MLGREKKTRVRGDYKRSWMSDDYFDLIVWYERSNAIHGFQLCYGKPQWERALTWLKRTGFAHHEIDSGEESAKFNHAPILVPDGSFPAKEVEREFLRRSTQLPKSLRNFVASKISQFSAKRKA